MFLFFELFIFMTMYVWYYARKINNSYTKFTDIGKITALIAELSSDISIPKFSTHLVYLTKANMKHQIEEKIIKSILAKKPKRADVYWFLHINRTEHPYTLSYEVEELLHDKIIKINMNVGFRIIPRSELYFKKIVSALIANQELNLHIRPDGSTKYNCEPDLKFVIIEKFLSVENEFTIRDGILLKSYFFLKKLGQRDEKAFGLDKSDIAIEYIPLLYHPVNTISLKRINYTK